MINPLRFIWRAVCLIVHLLKGMAQVSYLKFSDGQHWHQSDRGKEIFSCWMKQLTHILGLQVQVTSPPLPMPAMIVANHISWLDVVAIGSVRPAQFIAKENVQCWPLVGEIAKRSGTHFIKRNSAIALRESNRKLCYSLRIRQHVVVFPEGTTTSGADVGVFHSGLFESARRAYCPVQPLAIRYRRDNMRDDIAPYVGDELFLIHLWKILGRKQTRVELNFLPPISSRQHRRDLALQSREMIVSALEKSELMPSPMPVLQPLLCCAALVK